MYTLLLNAYNSLFRSNSEGEGRQLEAELNKKGPGEACFIFCDVTKEDDIKVNKKKMIRNIRRI